jgi:hypothetical protein
MVELKDIYNNQSYFGYAMYAQEESNGTSISTTGSSWNSYSFNTIIDEDSDNISLSSGRVVLEPGTYLIIGNCSVYQSRGHTVGIRDYPTGNILAQGMTGYSNRSANRNSGPDTVEGIVTVASQTTITLDAYVDGADGLGLLKPISMGDAERAANILIICLTEIKTYES